MENDNKIVTVDLCDNEIGIEEKIWVHKNNVLHRAFSVFLFNGDRVLLQKRAQNKYHSGGLWTNTCCSHHKAGKSLEESVKLTLLRELGITCNVREIGSFLYFAQFEGLSEYEYDHVFVGEYIGEVFINKDEVSDVRWIKIDVLMQDMLKNPLNYTVWFFYASKIAFQYYLNS